MKRIEFIGASGVGKTTLLKHLLDERAPEDKWLTNIEFKIQLARKLKIASPIVSKRNLMILKLRLNLLKDKHPGISNYLLKPYEDSAIEHNVEPYHGFLDLITKNLSGSDNLSAAKKIKLMEYWFARIKTVALFDYFDQNSIVVFDESIIHNNPGTSDLKAYRKMLDSRPDFASIINPLAVVFCRLSPEENHKRQIKRKEKNNLQGSPEALLVDNLSKAQCIRRLEESKRKADVMEKVGVPVYEVNMAESPAHNAKRIIKFIRQFSA